MEGTWVSLLPPIIAIVMAVVTRRVLVSLGSGIIVGLLLVKDFSISASGEHVYAIVKSILTDTWYLYIIFFLFLLGIIISLITISGGARAFGEWAIKRVKTRTGAKLLTIFLGLIIFIDDYFNTLTVGSVVRPLTDKHKISRAKLAYFVDSTSAPICIVTPISSWGAVIIGTIGGVLAQHSLTNISAFSAFMEMIPMNFYFIYAILFVFAVAIFNINIGPMRKHEKLAIETGVLFDSSKEGAPQEQEELVNKGKVIHLLLPFAALIIGTFAAMIWTGINAIDEGSITAMKIAENIDVTLSLLYGGLFSAVLSTFLLLATRFARKEGENRTSIIDNVFFPIVMFINVFALASIWNDITVSILYGVLFFFLALIATQTKVGTGVLRGSLSMVTTSLILIFAWILTTVIGDLGTGEYLADLTKMLSISAVFLPALIFILAGIMAFATGTSWGTFGVMLPIAGEIAVATDVTLLLPMLAAVLAGAVFGDHASPISDTTILSSTGAGSPHIDHVVTQLPYALMVAGLSIIGYIVLGLTSSVLLSIVVSFGAFVFLVMYLRKTAS
jgi:tetracycline resistance efflux pump